MDTPARLKQYMKDGGPLILDGGLATELEAQGAKLQGDPLWSARLLHTNPQAIRDVHLRFLQSGADVITTATYQASIEGLTEHLNVSPEKARELLTSGVHLAKETVESFGPESQRAGRSCPLVAGSVGPYGAFLHDGSEYTGAYAEHMSVEDFRSWHRPQVECLTAAGVDFLAFETIPSIKEGEALLDLLCEFPNCKAWLSFSCKDEKHISDGSLFSEVVQVANRSSQLVAVGLNCCSPDLVEPLLDSAQPLLNPELGWVVYPNSGEEWDTQLGWLKPERSSSSVLTLSHTWKKKGAALIGGCCRIGPAQITQLRQELKGSCTTKD